ncbi:MAG: nitroreductase family protein [Myxococcales bacterium]|nr:nitroreductase family protein [Myxococcales bacterium]
MAHIPYRPAPVPAEEGLRRGEALLADLDGRRSVRTFSDAPVPRAMIETAIRTASTAPSGAHKQPWTFAAISDPALKRRIRVEAEREERKSYEERMSREWKDALEPLGTTWEKPYLEVVPWIVVLFAQLHAVDPQGERVRHYYVQESCGIAAGMFITSLHTMGLATLTHTPSPMTFLRLALDRPPNEKAMILFPIGYPAADATVPDLVRKPLEDVSVWFTG